jgi:AcrR family transcriptional regulator
MMLLSSQAAQSSQREEPNVREHLLQATANAMVRSGTPKVSLQAVAKEANVTAPLIKYYFGSKEGLLLALAWRDTARSLRQLNDLMGMNVPPEEKLRIHIIGIVKTYARHPYLNGLLNLLLQDSKSASAKEIRSSFIEPLRQSQRKMIEDGIRAGRLKEIDPDLAYFAIIGACAYFFSNRNDLDDRDAETTRQLMTSYAKTVVDLILSGFLKHPTPHYGPWPITV